MTFLIGSSYRLYAVINFGGKTYSTGSEISVQWPTRSNSRWTLVLNTDSTTYESTFGDVGTDVVPTRCGGGSGKYCGSVAIGPYSIQVYVLGA